MVQHDLQTTPPPWLCPGLVCRESEVTLRCVDRVGYGEPAPGAGEEDWRGTSLVMGDQGQNWMSVTIHSGHELRAFTKTQTPCTIMPQNRWTRPRFYAFYAFYALGVLFSVIGGPCKRYAVTLTRMPSHNCLPGPHSAASARGAAM